MFTIFSFLSLPLVYAHYKLTEPTPRGSNELKQLTGPCADYPVSAERKAFPLTGGRLGISSFHNDAVMVSNVAFTSDPKSQSEFKTLTANLSVKAFGDLSTDNVDFSTFPEGKDGTEATIQTIFYGPDGALYQCADVKLSSAAKGASKSSSASACSHSFTLAALAVLPLVSL